MPQSGEDSRLAKVTEICLCFPEAERRLNGQHADFRVRTRIFAYFLHNHHDDGIVAVCCKADAGRNIERASREPLRFYLPKYIGARRLVRVAPRPQDRRLGGGAQSSRAELSTGRAPRAHQEPWACVPDAGPPRRPRPVTAEMTGVC
jgi:hypothetical protein